ncbi:outer membrane receptor for ferrienterochelin and colicin [Flavobacterium croceum DSM 17960]|uniref:Outer membrane receptor for ferrienterochelin and colicin n=1 Tax=Flavobacterium croceum DSM 17960 TaxID=1121886 RepID=A0A2S4N9A2_9FLAO|nr:TonB-dependent receptor plug domain-containing protein [Flavobacterium croceum]POS02288.1 outer membrane receptor for ferrienterochelin and colicin [Flavobacterium croceum DSM 17960]
MKHTLSAILVLFSVISFGQKQLKEVVIENKQKGMQKATNKVGNTTIVTSKELLKAACCNLAESFETNPSIDVNFSDALTGTKQIKMLGLTSPYILIAEENIPSVRGASQVYGLSFVPGTWVESIQITKGAGSVVNGYESISGQINTELIKPLKDIPLFINAYADTGSRYELNTQVSHKLSDNFATSFYIHTNVRTGKTDMNHDNFLDNPLSKQINITNRWQYTNAKKGWVTFFNIKYLKDDKQTGDVRFNPDTDKFTTNYWGSEINTERIDLSSKIGYVFKDMPFQSIGFQNAYSFHNQQSYFGLNTYHIKQESFYSNLIFNSIINNLHHKFAVGINFNADKYLEYALYTNYNRIDSGVGAYAEYTFDANEKLSYVLGTRVDYQNRLGLFFTPRLHVKYLAWNKGVFRFSAGRGKRAANIFAENQNLFASSRQFSILDSAGKLYGLNPEIAWNYGFSFNQKFSLFSRSAEFTIDAYRTDFKNQVVVDLMQSAQEVLFYNLKGKSYANSVQFDLNYNVIKHLNMRFSYKYYDIKTTYLLGDFQRPLQPKNRFFANIEYETHQNNDAYWKLDATLHVVGKQQLPNTTQNPITEQLPSFSSTYGLINAQLTRIFSKKFEMYLGGENIGNYRQEKAILGSHNPFSNHFDTTILYAPVFGQMYYLGLRFKIY